MKKYYVVIGVYCSISTGETVLLSAEQARSRLHNLEPENVNKDGSGTYVVKNSIQFKRGELFGYDGALPKSMASEAEEAKIEEVKAEEANEADKIKAKKAKVEEAKAKKARK